MVGCPASDERVNYRFCAAELYQSQHQPHGTASHESRFSCSRYVLSTHMTKSGQFLMWRDVIAHRAVCSRVAEPRVVMASCRHGSNPRRERSSRSSMASQTYFCCRLAPFVCINAVAVWSVPVGGLEFLPSKPCLTSKSPVQSKIERAFAIDLSLLCYRSESV